MTLLLKSPALKNAKIFRWKRKSQIKKPTETEINKLLLIKMFSSIVRRRGRDQA